MTQLSSLLSRPHTCSDQWHLHAQVELLTWRSIKDLTSDGGVIKTVLEEGTGWNKPADKDEALGEPSHRLGAVCSNPWCTLSSGWALLGRLCPLCKMRLQAALHLQCGLPTPVQHTLAGPFSQLVRRGTLNTRAQWTDGISTHGAQSGTL